MTALMEMPTMLRLQGRDLPGWFAEEGEAWAMPELIPTAEWVEQHIRIPSKGSALPGPISLDLTPYLRGPFEAVDDPAIDTITLLTGTQVGKTTFLYGSLLAEMVQRPGPRLIVMPTEPSAREVAGTTLRDMARDCEPFMELTVAGDASLTKEGYYLRTGNIYFGWSNSAESLARRACRDVRYDEVGKFPPYVGKETDPLRLGDKRLRTFRNTTGAKSIRASSPTTPDSLEVQSYADSDQRTFRVPCGKCGAYQGLAWSQVTWPHTKDGRSVEPDQIEAKGSARYTCAECGAKWSDYQKNVAVGRGIWARAGETVDKRGRIGGRPKVAGSHAGFHVSALYSPFTRLSQLAVAFIRATRAGRIALQDFINNELGEVWEEKEVVTSESELAKHRGPYKRGVLDPGTGQVIGDLPRGVQIVTAFIDVQRPGFYIRCRGWGFGLESWGLDYRRIPTEAALLRYVKTTRFIRGGAAAAKKDPKGAARAAPIWLVLIDSGDQTSYVYGLVDNWRGDGIDIRPTKGRESEGPIFMVSPRRKDPITGKRYRNEVPLLVFNVGYCKGMQARMVNATAAGPGFYHIEGDVDDDFLRQATAEELVVDRMRGRTGRSRRRPAKVWKLKAGRLANHYWDCDVGNCLAAEALNLRALPDPSATAPRRRETKSRTEKKSEAWEPRPFGDVL